MKAEDAPIRDEYDFSKAVKNPYAARARAGSDTDVHLVVLEPDVAAGFPSAEEVNQALRDVLRTRAAS